MLRHGVGRRFLNNPKALGQRFTLEPNVLPALLSVEETNPTIKTVNMQNGKRYSVGVVMLKTDDGTSIDVILGAMPNKLFTAEASNLENVESDYFEDGVVFEFTGTSGDTTVEVVETAGNTGKIKGLIIREADPVSGTVAAWSGGLHSGAQNFMHNDKLVMCHVEMYTGDRYISYDKKPVGKLPIPASQLDDNDTYHQSIAGLSILDGVFFAATDHQGHLRGVWASTPEEAISATPFDIESSSVDATYARITKYGNAQDVGVYSLTDDATDSSGNGYDATNNGAVFNGEYALLDGTDNLTIPSSDIGAALNSVGTGDFKISIDVYIPATGTINLWNWKSASTLDDLALVVIGSGVSLYSRIDGVGSFVSGLTTTVSADTWTTLELARVSGTYKLIKDNVVVATASSTEDFSNHDNDRDFAVGSNQNGSSQVTGRIRNLKFTTGTSETAYLISRAHPGGVGGRMYTIHNLDTTPEILTDVLQTTTRHYPRNFEIVFDDANNPLIFHAFQQRDGSLWGRISAIIYDILADRWYDCNGVLRGTVAKGTSGTPRFSSTEVQGETFTGSTNGITILGVLSLQQRYTANNFTGKVREWNGTTRKFDLFFPFFDHSTSDPNDYTEQADSDLRLCAVINGTRYATASDANPLGIVNNSSYRFYWDFKNDGDDALMIMTERRRRYVGSHRFDESEAYNIYWDWGATRVSKYRFNDIFLASSASDITDSVEKLDTIEFGDDKLGSNNFARLSVLKTDFIEDNEDYFVVDVAQNELHSTKRQGQNHIFKFDTIVNGSDYEDGGRDVSDGVAITSIGTNLSFTCQEADSKQALIYTSFDFRYDLSSTDPACLVRADGAKILVDFPNDAVRVICRNAAGTTILQATGATTFSAASSITTLLIAIDLSGATDDDKLKVYINDVKESLTFVTAVDDIINFNGQDTLVYNSALGGTVRAFRADIERSYMAFGQHLDIDIEVNRRKFYTEFGKPVSLGSDGSTPTGSQPTIYLKGGVSEHGTNLGDGGALTQSGAFLMARNVSGDYSKVKIFDNG